MSRLHQEQLILPAQLVRMEWTSGACCPQYKGPSLNITSRSRHLALQGFRDASGSLFRCADRPSKARGRACQAEKAEQDEKACSFKWLPWISMGVAKAVSLATSLSAQSTSWVIVPGPCPSVQVAPSPSHLWLTDQSTSQLLGWLGPGSSLQTQS